MDDLTRIRGIGKAVARKLATAGIDTMEKLAAAVPDAPAFDGIANARVAGDWIDTARDMLAAHQDTQGKPPRPDEQGGSAEARPIPADSGAGDPQQDNPRGSSGTAREASSTGGGTTAETPSVGTQSGSPNLSSDTETMEAAAATKLAGPHEIGSQPAGAGELILRNIATVASGERRRFPVNWALMHDGRLVAGGGTVELTLFDHQKLAGGVISASWLDGEIVE